MVTVTNGSYSVRQVIGHDDKGEILGKAVGFFEVVDGKVARKSGLADDLLRLGTVEGINTWRITVSFHNGYLTVVPEAYQEMPEEEAIEK